MITAGTLRTFAGIVQASAVTATPWPSSRPHNYP